VGLFAYIPSRVRREGGDTVLHSSIQPIKS